MIDSKAFYEHIDEHQKTTTQIEDSILGAVVKQPSCIVHACETITGSDCQNVDAGRVFDHIAKMVQLSEPVDDVTWLVKSLRQAGLLDGIGGIPGIAKLSQEGMPHHIRSYAAETLKWSQIRKLRSVAASILSNTDQANPNPVDIAANAANAITIATASNSSDLATAEEVCSDALESIDRAVMSGSQIGTPTGISAIDRHTGGLFNELTIIAARPSVGKTAFGLDLAARAAGDGQRILFCSLEMSSEQIAHRLLSRETGISTQAIRAGGLTSQQRKDLEASRIAMRKWPWRFWAQSGVTVSQIQSKARMHAAKFGLDLLVVDYLGLIRPSNTKVSRYEAVTQISNDLATMAKQLGRPVLCLCQLSRGAENEIPRLDHLRDSGAIEQDADNVWFLHRERGKPETQLIVAKARQAEVGTLDLWFDANRCSFGDPVKTWNANHSGGFFDEVTK